MKLKEVFNKKLVAWSVSLTMAFTMIPAMGTAVYADETEDVQDNAAPVAEEQVSEEAEQGTSETSEEVDVVASVEEETVAETSAATREKVSVSTEEETYTSSNKTDSDTLLMGYLNQELGVNQDVELLSTDNKYYNQLSNTNKKLYSALKNKVQAIASGDDNTVQIKIGASELEFEKDCWTAAELGVERIYDEENNSLTPEAEAALNARLPYNAGKVLNALLADMPYEMYWFDKTSTKVDGKKVGGMNTYLSNIQLGSDEEGEILFIDESEVTVSFYVSADYSLSGKIGTFELDPDKIAAVNDAIANAKSIVERNASSNDYNKMVAYKEEICDLVSYNDEAVETEGYPYGDPWQLIYVFDGDEDTNVVCEGYSKSFQYLCDMSSFKQNTQCYSVSGNLFTEDDQDKPEPHMWNIVTMKDGINYLVDITNCDEGTIGSPDELFMVSPSAGSPEDGYRFDISSGDCVYYTYDEAKMDEFGDIMYLKGDGRYDPIPEITSVKLKSDSAVYTGKAIKPEVVVTDDNGDAVDPSYYAVSTSPATVKNVGKYTVKVTFNGIYADKGSVNLTFKVNPVKTAISKLSKGKKRFTVKWTKKSKSLVDGYQIQYSTSSKFASGNKTVTVRSYKTGSKTVKKLKAKKTYYVRVRTFKKVSGTYYYAPWSASKAVKTK